MRASSTESASDERAASPCSRRRSPTRATTSRESRRNGMKRSPGCEQQSKSEPHCSSSSANPDSQHVAAPSTTRGSDGSSHSRGRTRRAAVSCYPCRSTSHDACSLAATRRWTADHQRPQRVADFEHGRNVQSASCVLRAELGNALASRASPPHACGKTTARQRTAPREPQPIAATTARVAARLASQSAQRPTRASPPAEKMTPPGAAMSITAA